MPRVLSGVVGLAVSVGLGMTPLAAQEGGVDDPNGASPTPTSCATPSVWAGALLPQVSQSVRNDTSPPLSELSPAPPPAEPADILPPRRRPLPDAACPSPTPTP